MLVVRIPAPAPLPPHHSETTESVSKCCQSPLQDLITSCWEPLLQGNRSHFPLERSLLPPLLFTYPPFGHFYVRQQNPLLGLSYRMQWCFKGFFFFLFAINISVLSTQECCFLFGDNPEAVPPSEPPFYLFSSFSSPSPASEIRPVFLYTFWSGKKLSQSLWLSLKQPESQGLQQSYSQKQTALVWSHPWSPWKEPQLFFLWKILPEM